MCALLGVSVLVSVSQWISLFKMADLPHHDLQTDEAPAQLRRLQGRVPQLPYGSDDKQFTTMEDRVDSGVGYSLESQEYSALSIEGVRDYLATDAGRACVRHVIENRTSASTPDSLACTLQNQLRNLSIGDIDQTKLPVRSSRCDSGICDSGNFSTEEPFPVIQSAFPECGPCDSFSEQEVDELFSQDEDGDT